LGEVTMPHETLARTGDSVTTAVLLCQDLEALGPGLAPEELRPFLEDRFPNLSVEVVPELCHQPGRPLKGAGGRGAERAVLVLCSGDYSEVELQARARKAGLDPFGVEVVPLGALCAGVPSRAQATRKAKALLAAAVARARAYQGSEPEQMKPHFVSWDQGVSRRSLFTLPPIGYQPVPGFNQQLCAAASGCDLCAKACPRDALSRQGEHITLDKTRCESCGVCLTACPRGALDMPGCSLPQFEAQLSALLDPGVVGPEAPGILFTCRRAAGQLEGHGVSSSPFWLPVVVPCLGMVTPAWVLQALAHGAGEVALLVCGQKCSLGQQPAIYGRADFCRHLLEMMGQAPDRVKVLTASDPEGLSQTLHHPPRQGRVSQHRDGGQLCLGATGGALEGIRRLSDGGAASPGLLLEHPHSPFGVLELRAGSCTGCLACAQACPTGALESEHSGNAVRITYEASSCSGCGICMRVCPETSAQVLQVRRMTRLGTLSRGRMVLHQAQLATCEGCGASIATQVHLRRIEESLGGGSEALLGHIGRYCPSCRSAFAWGARASSS
jgi:ferredoxin